MSLAILKSGNNESGFSDGGSAACTSLHRKAYCFGIGISLNPFEGGIQIVLHAEVPFEKGKFEKEIISEISFTEDVTAKKLMMRPFVRFYLKKQQTRYVTDLKEILAKLTAEE